MPELAVKLVPAIPATKSTMLSFLLPFESFASMIATLSFATSTAAADSSFKSTDNTPELAANPFPATAVIRSDIDSFLLPFESFESIIAKLSALTSTAAADSSFKSNAKDTVPDVPPPDKPLPAVTPSISPASLVKLNTPADAL